MDLANLLGVELSRCIEALQETGCNVDRAASWLLDHEDASAAPSVARGTDPSEWSIQRLRDRLAFAGIDSSSCVEKADLVALVRANGLHSQAEAFSTATSVAPRGPDSGNAVAQRDGTENVEGCKVSSDTTPPPPTEGTVDDCPICQESICLADAAMRCFGDGHDKRHYFHASCLAQWIRKCSAASARPTCPMCRGPIQVNSRRLGEFLSQKGGDLDEQDNEVLRNLCRPPNQRRPTPAASSSSRLGTRYADEWEEPEWEVALATLAAAGALIGFGA
eukprot:EG_transcript_22321